MDSNTTKPSTLLVVTLSILTAIYAIWQFWLSGFLDSFFLDMGLLQEDIPAIKLSISLLLFVTAGAVPPFYNVFKKNSELVELEKSLEDERKEAEVFLDLAEVIFLALDANFNIGLINKKGTQVLGYSKQVISGKNWFTTFIPEKYRSQAKKDFQDLVKGNANSKMISYPILTKDGKELIYDWHISQMKDQEGIVYAFLCSGSDKQMARDLQETRKRYDNQIKILSSDLLANNKKLQSQKNQFDLVQAQLAHWVELEKILSPCLTHLPDLSSREIDEIIEKALALIGNYSQADQGYVFLFSDDVTEMDNSHMWSATLAPEHIEKTKDIPLNDFPWFKKKILAQEIILVSSVDKMPEEASVEKHVFKSQGIVSFLNIPMVFEGKSIGYLGFESMKNIDWRDEEISQIKMMGEVFSNALMRGKETSSVGIDPLHSALSSGFLQVSKAGIFSFDHELLLTQWNPVMENLTGVDTQSALGKNVFELLPGLTGSDEEEAIRKTLDGSSRQFSDRSLPFTVSGGKEIFEITCSPLRDENQGLMGGMVVLQDFTESRLAQQDLIQARQELEQQVKSLEEKLQSEQEKMERELAMREQAEKEIREKREVLETEVETLNKQLADEKEKLEKEINSREQAEINLKLTRKTLETQVSELSQRIQEEQESYQQKVESKKSEESELEASRKEMEDKIERLTGELESEREKLKNEIETRSSKEEEARESRLDLEDTVQRLTAELDEERSKMQFEIDARDQAEEEVRDIRLQLEHQLKNLSQDEKEKQAQLEQEIEERKKAEEDLRAIRLNLENQVQELNKRLEQDQNRLQAEIEARERDEALLRENRERFERQIEDLSNELEAERIRLQPEIEKRQQAENESKQLRQDMEVKINDLTKELEAERARLEAEIVNQKQDEEQLHEMRSTLENRVEELNRELEEERNRLRTEIDSRRKAEEEIQESRRFLENQAQLKTQELEKEAEQLNQEIEQYKEKEETYREIHERYRSLSENSGLIIVSLSEKNKIADFNPQAEKTLGWNKENTLDADFLELVLPKEIREPVAAQVAEELAMKPCGSFESALKVPDGSRRLFHWNVISQKDAKNHSMGALVVGHDITETKHAQKAIKENKLFIHTVIDNAIDGFVTMDENGTVLSLNPAAERIFGFSSREVEGQNVNLLMPESHLSDHESIINHYLLSGRTLDSSAETREVIGRHKNGSSFPIDITLGEMYQDSQRQFLCIVRDITVRKRLERQLIDSEEKYRLLVTAESDAVIVTDAVSRRCLEANDAALNLYGHTRDEFGKLSLGDISAEPEKMIESLVELSPGKFNKIPLIYHKKRDGTIFLAEITHGMYRSQNQSKVIWLIRDITENKRVEELLRDSEKQLQVILNHINGFVYLKDTEERYQMVNKTFESLFEVSGDDIRGKTDQEIFPPELAEAFETRDRQALQAEALQENEQVVSLKDGTHVFQTVQFPLRNSSGDLYAICGIACDVTERKRDHEELLRLRERLRNADIHLRDSQEEMVSILNQLDRVVYIKDREGRYRTVNSRFESLFNVHSKDVLGKADVDIFSREIIEEFDGQDQKVIETGVSLETEETVIHEDGPHIYHSIKFPLRDVSGQLYGVCGISTDITERKRMQDDLNKHKDRLNEAQGAIERAREELSKVVSRFDAAVAIKDLDGRYRLINKLYEDLYHQAGGSMTGKSDYEIFAPDLAEQFTKLDKSLIKSGKIQNIREEISLGEETRIVQSTRFVLKDSAGEPYAICNLIRDETEAERSKLELLEFRQEMEQRVERRTAYLKAQHEKQLRHEKMSAIGELSNTISHKVNHPIQGISNILQQLGDRVPFEDFDKGLVDLAIKECGRVTGLIKRLENCYRLGLDQTTGIDIHALADQVLLELAPTFEERKIETESHYASDMPQLEGDVSQIKEAIQNILCNAEESIEKGKLGKLRVSTEVLNAEVILHIEDNGCGIPPENLKSIFNPFYTTKSGMKKSGMGLAFSYGIIKRHGGDILVKSTPTKGSTFSIVLPRDFKKNAPKAAGGKEISEA